MNIGMYVVAPVTLVLKFWKKHLGTI